MTEQSLTIKDDFMLPSRNPFRLTGLSLILATVLLPFAATPEAGASPIHTRIVYSTSSTDFPLTANGKTVFDFVPVTNGIADSETQIRLGTIQVHHQGEGPGYYFDLTNFRITFSAAELDPFEGLSEPTAVTFDNTLNAAVYQDGKVYGAMIPIWGRGYEPLLIDGNPFVLRAVEVAPLWNVDARTSITSVDVYARFEAAPVPEPATWAVFAVAAGFGWHRFGRKKAASPARG